MGNEICFYNKPTKGQRVSANKPKCIDKSVKNCENCAIINKKLLLFIPFLPLRGPSPLPNYNKIHIYETTGHRKKTPFRNANLFLLFS